MFFTYPERNVDCGWPAPVVPAHFPDPPGSAEPPADPAPASAVSPVSLPIALVDLVERGVKVQEDEAGEVAEDDVFDEAGDGVASHPAVVDVQGDDGHGRSKGHQTDGHTVVKT